VPVEYLVNGIHGWEIQGGCSHRAIEHIQRKERTIMKYFNYSRGLTFSLTLLLATAGSAIAADGKIQQVNHVGNYGTVMPYQGAQAGYVNYEDHNTCLPLYDQRYAHTSGYRSFTRTPGGRICDCNCGGDCGHIHCTSALAEATWNFRMRNAAASQRLFGNRGCGCRGGVGSCRLFWWDLGRQKDIIAVNPGYHDSRDSEMYATQMYGVPTAVPLAPVVRDSYNYGWGMPASRLTPVATHPVP